VEATAQQPDARATAVVDRAIELMGGRDVLQEVDRVVLDMMTQWQRTSFREVPWTDRPSYELHHDVRDYTIPAWRNTRTFGTNTITNIVRDSVAATNPCAWPCLLHGGNGFQPLSVAYVDERNELFAYTPDRLVLLARNAADLRLAGDTVIGREPHTLVHATLGGWLPATIAFHKGTGLPALLRFRRGHPNDFGLVPWGDMWVHIWYSNWRSFGAISIPTQWDIQRVGRPYKRMTVRNANFNPQIEPDSFQVADELRRAFIESRRPMHDRAIDSVTTAAPGLVAVHGFGFPAGAISIGDQWLLLEGGHAPLSLERAQEALRSAGVEKVGGAILASASAGNGGVIEMVRTGLAVYASPAAEPLIRTMLENAGLPFRNVTVVTSARSVGQGESRLEIATVDLPDVPGSILLYSPRLQWLYAPNAVTNLDVRVALDASRRNGWTVTRLGTARGLSVPLPR
jgi:hypothetical protein